MKLRNPWVLILGLLLITLGALALLQLAISPLGNSPQILKLEHPKIKTPESIPSSLKIHFFQNEPETIDSVLKRHPVIIVNFWAEWCTACLIEMPSLNALHHHLKDQGLLVVAMSVDEAPQVSIPKIKKKLNLSLPMAFDQQQHWSDLFDIHGLPFTVILNHNKEILHVELGERDWNTPELRSKIQEWLAQF